MSASHTANKRMGIVRESTMACSFRSLGHMLQHGVGAGSALLFTFLYNGERTAYLAVFQSEK